MIDMRRSVVPSGTGNPRRLASGHRARRSAIRHGTALAGIATAMALASPATAADECGVLPGGGGTVTCSDVDNPFPNGITYVTPTDPITLVAGDTIVVTTAGADLEGNDNDGGTGTVAVNSAAAIMTAGDNAEGIEVNTTTGDASVRHDGTINTSGSGAEGIRINTTSGNASITGTGNVSTTGPSTETVEAVSLTSNGGAIDVTIAGASAAGDNGDGVFASAGGGNISVTSTGAISTAGQSGGFGSVGIRVTTSGTGTVTINATSVSTTGTDDGNDAIQATTAGYGVDIDGDAYGVRLEAGYRWGSASGFFAEPMVSIEYQSTSLDDYSALGATVDFDSFDGLRGQAGLRLGGRSTIGGGSTLTYYGGGHVVHEFEGDGSITFASGTSSIGLVNDPRETFGRFELGVNIATVGGVSGFVEGNADIGDDYQGYGGRAGIRIAF
ncbi:MAG: autotransporter domain-containing protein [Pseudomonadota bacterium]